MNLITSSKQYKKDSVACVMYSSTVAKLSIARYTVMQIFLYAAPKVEISLSVPAHVTPEFLYSDDMADACVFLMNLPDDEFIQLLWPAGSPRESVNSGLAPFINIGAGIDLTIRELAEYVCEVVSYSGAPRV